MHINMHKPQILLSLYAILYRERSGRIYKSLHSFLCLKKPKGALAGPFVESHGALWYNQKLKIIL